MTQVSTKIRMIETLYNHHEFRDCILEDVHWRKGGAELDLIFNYIWPDTDACYYDHEGRRQIRDSKVREDLDKPLYRSIRFYLVQEFCVHNYLNSKMLEHPESLDWGFSEIAGIQVTNDSEYLAKYRHHPLEFHHVQVIWSGDRRVDIVCTRLEVLSSRDKLAVARGG